MVDKDNFTIIFDNASSAHKEGFIEHVSLNSKLRIIHLRKNIFNIDPSEEMNKDSKFNKFRYYFSTNNSINKIVKQINIELINVIQEKRKINFI